MKINHPDSLGRTKDSCKVYINLLSIDVVGLILHVGRQPAESAVTSKKAMWDYYDWRFLKQNNLVCVSLTLSWWHRSVQEWQESGWWWLSSQLVCSKKQSFSFQDELFSGFMVNWSPEHFINKNFFFLKVKAFLIHVTAQLKNKKNIRLEIECRLWHLCLCSYQCRAYSPIKKRPEILGVIFCQH